MFNNIRYLIAISAIATSTIQAQTTEAFKMSEESRCSVSYERFLRLNQPASGKRDAFDWLEARCLYDLKRGNIKGRFDGDIRFFINNKKVNLSLAEAYFSYRGITKTEHILGRQKLNWHPNETFWQLGHLNGLRNFRLMDQKQEGLLGYRLKTTYGPIKAEYFLSLFYIPTLNPSIELENGQVVSNTDWYRSPPKQVIIKPDGSPTNTQYEINQPDLRNIIFQKSIGGRLAYDWKKGKVRKKKKNKKNKKREEEKSNLFGDGEISGYIIYKPETSVRINASTIYTLTTDGLLPVRADPIVNHHIIFGGTLKQDIGMSKNTAGITYVDPTAKLGSDFNTLSLDIQNVDPVFRDGFLIDPTYDQESYLHFSSQLPGDILSFGINGIHYLTKHEKGNDDFRGDTVRWLSAIGFNANYRFNDFMNFEVNFRYDFKREDNLLDLKAIFHPINNAFIIVGLELIKAPSDKSYWTPYRTNDTGYIKLALSF
jgi:hypothetical protein